jgi:DNA repair ATPase RecN
VREDLKAHPEKLAEWDALMQDYAQAVEEDRKEAEERRLTEEIGERVDQISADIDRLMELDPLDLDVDAALARNFAAMHELDAVMRERCRDYPAQLARWEEEVMGHLKELEAICAAAWEAEKAQPEN